MTSPGCEAGLAGGPAGDDRATISAPLRLWQAERLRSRFATATGVDLDADHAARDLAGAQLRQQVADGVDRRREADADVGRLRCESV